LLPRSDISGRVIVCALHGTELADCSRYGARALRRPQTAAAVITAERRNERKRGVQPDRALTSPALAASQAPTTRV
jgi:hypothetical protein